ncbi:uncharacterized protein LOC129226500 isoform X2 [Uloborus diversus]|uniref:uncharacterized protein LOC129226500 isoform X2 n=1 Tax=Uloborus diversus TaxID=327109 RepID=UPI00240A1908|nr:uncharacterized protein LOC129226500 isoform X2 [Uloborus diversus]
MLQRVRFCSQASVSDVQKLTSLFSCLLNDVQVRSYRRGGIFDEENEDKSYNYNDSSYERRNNQQKSFGYSENYRPDYRRDRFNQRPRFNQRNNFQFNNYTNNQQSFAKDLTKPIFDMNSLPPVEKYFYIEHSDVTDRSLEEVQKYRELYNIGVRGRDVPKPITSFSELSIPDKLMNVLKSQEYSEPTPIQSQGWPVALSGRDMVGISQTGSGKTLVFMLPAVIHAINQQSSDPQWAECKPQVLVLAPTRELVQQIHEVSHKFVTSCNLLSCCVYGGASKVNQRRYLNGSQICIATPGRLIDFVSENAINLNHCTYLVLDEADRMLDMGFEPQIRQIINQIRPDRQTLMWSATWPREIQNLAEDFLSDYVQITIGSGQLAANPKIEQNIYVMMEGEKDDRLVSLLEEIVNRKENKVLVFAQTKKKVDYLDMFLHHHKINAMCIHGDVSQSKRDYVLKSFRELKKCVLIATDVAARGLDITDIDHVINYDFPLNIEDYIHRIGRTARGNASGVAHSFFTSENSGVVRDLLSVLKAAGQPIPPELLSMSPSNQRTFKGNRFMAPRKSFRKEYAFSAY